MAISETTFMETTNLRRSWKRKGGVLAVTLCGCALALAGAPSARAQTQTSSESVNQQELSAHSYQEHHYASPAERAEDALLIVKVKAAIADAGLADNDPLTVDADHGRITLAGVLDSHQNVDRAVALVAGIDGVTGVNNRLTWQKSP
jgi:osmotically-inducible protein OsmY